MTTTLAHSITPEDRMTYDRRPVQFMVTCLCDAFFDEAAKASVEVLERLGVEVVFPPDQTCCGQPSFNAGDWDATRKVVRNMLKAFDESSLIVVPSGSCVSMVLHGAQMAFEGYPEQDRVRQLARRTWELTDFIVNGLGVTRWPGHHDGPIALHHSCHCRGTNSLPAATALLESIEGVELVEYGEKEQCCGFGGAFSVSFPETSKKIGALKLNHLLQNRPKYIASLDTGCLLHLGGLLDRDGVPTQRRHVAEILRDAVQREAGAWGAEEAL